jgi:argininosuccinate lyase
MSKKVWNKGTDTSAVVESFTVGNDRVLDKVLAPYDVQGSKAHVEMLGSVGLLSKEETQILVDGLDSIYEIVIKEAFEIPVGFEDIHSYVEYLLVEKLGDVGKKVHTGRSRNDQVLVDLHLYLKTEIADLIALTKKLFDQLIALGKQHQHVGLPGYTHFQVAMPSSFGLWFGAYAESLIDDTIFLQAALKIADQNPLGSAAGYGSSFPLDRQLTTELLGFSTLKVNSVAAQMSRGKLEKSTAFSMASLAGTLSKFAMDAVLYMNQNFGFISFPNELTTGSSIMPHKRNPDVFELIRAKCNSIQALPTEIGFLINNLPSGYHRDFQLLKENLFSGLEELTSCITMTGHMLDHIMINSDILGSDEYQLLYTVEEVNKLVIAGVPFRDAYHQVSDRVKSGSFEKNEPLKHSHIGSIDTPAFELIEEKYTKMTS